MLGERVEEVVDDVGSEDLDALLVGILLRFLVDLDVEAEHDRIIGRLLQHDTALHDVALVDGTDTDVGDGDLALLEEVEQGLERTKGRGLDGDTAAGLLDTAEERGKIGLDLVLEIVLVVVGTDDKETGTGNGTLETGGGNLDTQSGLDLLVVDVLRLETQFPERRGREQRSDICFDDAFCTAQDDTITLPEDTVGENDIDSHTETLDSLDFKDGGLDLGEVHERANHALLGELNDELQHVGDTLAGVGGGGDQGDVFGHGLVLVEKLRVETLLGESELGLVETVLELVLDSLVLESQRLLEAVVLDLLPAVKTIDLVESDDEGGLPVTEELHGLESLGLETVHDIDNQDGDVAKRRTTRTQVGERLVTGGIDDEETGNLELELAVAVDNSRLLLDGLNGEVSGTNLLSDTTGFAFLDVGLTNLVEQLRLTGIDVTKNTANGRAKVVGRAGRKGSLMGLLTTLSSLLLPPGLLLFPGGGLLVLRFGFLFRLLFGLLLRLVLILVLLGLSLAVGSGGLSSLLLLGLLLLVGVGIPAVLDILLVRGNGSLPVLVDAILSGSLSGSSLGSSLLLGLLALKASLLLLLLGKSLSGESGTLSGLGESLLLIPL